MTFSFGRERPCLTAGRQAQAKAAEGMDATTPAKRFESGAFWRS